MGPFLATQFGMVHEIYVTEQRSGVAGLLRVIVDAGESARWRQADEHPVRSDHLSRSTTCKRELLILRLPLLL